MVKVWLAWPVFCLLKKVKKWSKNIALEMNQCLPHWEPEKNPERSVECGQRAHVHDWVVRSRAVLLIDPKGRSLHLVSENLSCLMFVTWSGRKPLRQHPKCFIPQLPSCNCKCYISMEGPLPLANCLNAGHSPWWPLLWFQKSELFVLSFDFLQ